MYASYPLSSLDGEDAGKGEVEPWEEKEEKAVILYNKSMGQRKE